jgi:hypothetical protein
MNALDKLFAGYEPWNSRGVLRTHIVIVEEEGVMNVHVNSRSWPSDQFVSAQFDRESLLATNVEVLAPRMAEPLQLSCSLSANGVSYAFRGKRESDRNHLAKLARMHRSLSRTR